MGRRNDRGKREIKIFDARSFLTSPRPPFFGIFSHDLSVSSGETKGGGGVGDKRCNVELQIFITGIQGETHKSQYASWEIQSFTQKHSGPKSHTT